MNGLDYASVSPHLMINISPLNQRQRRSQLDKLVAAGCKVCDGNPPLLLDVLGHRLQLLPADVDELATVVNHT